MEEENAQTKKINIKKGIIFGAIFLIIISYGIYQAYELIKNPTNTVTVFYDKLYMKESTSGYIIRQEQVVKAENNENGIDEVKTEGEKVAKDDIIFRSNGENEVELTEKIEKLNVQIQESLGNNSFKNINSDITTLDKKIDYKIERIKNSNNLQDIVEYKKDINTLLSKKLALISNSSDISDDLKNLILQKEQYEEQLASGGQDATANQSGVVSYRVDGLEENFKTDDFNYLSSEFLNGLNLKTGQIVSSSNNCAKIVNNYKCYIAFVSNSNEANFASVGDKLTVGISTGDEISAKIVHIISENEQKIIVVEINKCVDKLISYRKVSIDVTWWSDSGLRVPNSALNEENGLYFVVRNRVGYMNKIIVKVLRKNENYSIVTNYTTEELSKLGLSDSEIKQMKKLKLYDDLILNPEINVEF